MWPIWDQELRGDHEGNLADVRYKDFGPIEESIGPLPFSIVAFEF
jgi:hypothetical protein